MMNKKAWFRPFDWAVILAAGIAVQYGAAVYCLIKFGVNDFTTLGSIVALATMAALVFELAAALIIGIRLHNRKNKTIGKAVIFGSVGLFVFMELFMLVWLLGLNAF